MMNSMIKKRCNIQGVGEKYIRMGLPDSQKRKNFRNIGKQ